MKRDRTVYTHSKDFTYSVQILDFSFPVWIYFLTSLNCTVPKPLKYELLLMVSLQMGIPTKGKQWKTGSAIDDLVP